MKPTTRRAVILIPRVVDAENTNADHPITADPAMQTMDASYSQGPDANMIPKQGPRSPTDSSALLSREQSPTCSDTDNDDAHAEDASIHGSDMVFALKQEQIDEHNNDGSSTHQEQQKTSEQDSTSEAEKLFIEQKEHKTECIHQQARNNKKNDDDYDSNANIAEPTVQQEEMTVDGKDDLKDLMARELEAKHKQVNVGKDGMQRHQGTPDNDFQGDIYKCARCPHRTSDFMSLMKHRQTLHNGRDYEGTSIKNLHLNPIINDPNYYCQACERRFPTKNNYKKHLKMVHHILALTESASSRAKDGSENTGPLITLADPQELKYNCRFCNELFDSMLSLTRHQISDHNKRKNGKKARCNDCNIHYRSSRAYMQHRQLVHNPKTADASANETPDLKIKCKVCGMGFGSVKAHLSHCNSVHRVYKKKTPENSDMDVESMMTTTDDLGQEQSTQKRPTRQKVKTVRFILPDSDPSSTTANITMTFRCKGCEIDFDTRPDLTRHRWSAHRDNMIAALNNKEKATQPTPTTTAVQYRCRSCLVQCESRSALSHHLSTVHKNFDYSSPKKKSVQTPSSATPTTSFRCSRCSTECDSRSALVVHLWAAHPESMRKTKKQSDADDEQAVKEPHKDSTAKRALSPPSSPDDTLDSTHSNTPASVASPHVPEISNLSFHCPLCDKTSRNKSSFYSHLLAVHSNNATDPSSHQQQQQQQPTTKKRASAVLDIDDPNNNCAFCDRTFESQDSFYRHLRSQHHIKRKLSTTPAITTASSRNSQTSPSEGKHLCSICRQRQTTLGHHRQHLRLAHKVKLPPINRDVIQFRYPNELIDINSPDLYCAQCDHYFNSKIFFKKHVEGVHRTAFST